MKKNLLFLGFCAAIVFPFCTATNKAKKTKAAPVRTINYTTDIAPLISSKCGPCHLSPNGRKKFLDNYVSASKFANEMIASIQKNPGERGFMPFKKTEKLSDSVINVFVQWKGMGLVEK